LAVLIASGHDSHLATAKTWADLVGTIITGLAILVGGLWAYFKFAKGRTFRPKVEIEMSGQWLTTERKKWLKVERQQWLQARIRVKNIGASKVRLRQEGTGLRVRVLAANQASPPDYAKWERAIWYVILDDHAWIEPGETVSDDLLLNLGTGPALARFDARLIVGQKKRNRIEVNARQVFPAEAVISRPQE
jgi:hypothetical protein